MEERIARERILRLLRDGGEDLEALSEALGLDLRGMSRVGVAMLYVKLGGDPERVSSFLDWRDFEDFVSRALEDAGMEVARRVRIPSPRGFEIDVLGVDVVSGAGLAVDCKHWSRPRGLSGAARQMVERLSRAVSRCEAVARAFAPFSRASRIYPAIVTLKDPGARSVHGVLLVPIHMLGDAIRGLPGYLEELGARAFHNPCAGSPGLPTNRGAPSPPGPGGSRRIRSSQPEPPQISAPGPFPASTGAPSPRPAAAELFPSHALLCGRALRFCSRCGRDEREAPVIRHLCAECYLEEHLPYLLPRSVELVECPSCRGLRVGGDWIYREEFGGDAKVVIAHLLEEAKSVPEGLEAVGVDDVELLEGEEGPRALAVLRISASGREHRISRTIAVHRRRVLCPLCRAHRGGSYEAVLKIRGLPSMSPSLASRVEKALSRLPEALRASIVEVERLREGVDLKLVSRHSAQAIAGILRRNLGGRVVSSEEGEGLSRPSGRRPRLVLSLRIPDLREGVYIRVRGRPYVVERVEEGYAVLSGRDGERVRESLERILRDWRP